MNTFQFRKVEYLRGLLLACVLLCGWTRPLLAQEQFPTRPIDFIVPWGPGGGSDQTARELAKLLEPELKVSVPVLNIPGATGNTGMAKLLAAPADGYTICILAWDTYAQLATSQPKWKLADIVPLAIVIQLPSGFYVAEGSRFKNWQELETEAKAKPGTLKVAISGFGSPDDITINYFAGRGVKLLAVPFANPGQRYAALLGGHVDVLYSPAGNIISQVESKQMRPVMFFAAERLPTFKDTPTSKELGYDITLPQRRAIIVRAGTDPARIKMLTNAIAKVTADPEYKAFLKTSLAAEDSYLAAEASQKIMQSDLANMKQIVESMGKK